MSHLPPMPRLTPLHKRRTNTVLQPQRKGGQTYNGVVPPNGHTGYPVMPQQTVSGYQHHSPSQPMLYNSYSSPMVGNSHEQYFNPQRHFSTMNYTMGENTTNYQPTANVTNQHMFQPTEMQQPRSHIQTSNLHLGYNNHQNDQVVQQQSPWALKRWHQYQYNQTFQMQHMQQQVEVEVNMRQRYLDKRNSQHVTTERQYTNQHQEHGMQAALPSVPFPNQHLSATDTLRRLHWLSQQHEKANPTLSHIPQGRLPSPLLHEVEGRDGQVNEFPEPQSQLGYPQGITDLVEPQTSRLNFDNVEATTTSKPNSATRVQTHKNSQVVIQEISMDNGSAPQIGRSVHQKQKPVIPPINIDDNERTKNSHPNDRYEMSFQKTNMNCLSDAQNSYTSLDSLTETKQDPTNPTVGDGSTFHETLSQSPLNFNPTPPPTPPDDHNLNIYGTITESDSSSGFLPLAEISGIFQDGHNAQETLDTIKHERSHSPRPQSQQEISFAKTHYSDTPSVCLDNTETSQNSLNVEQSSNNQDTVIIEHESGPIEQLTIPQTKDSTKDSQCEGDNSVDNNEELGDSRQSVVTDKYNCIASSGFMSPHYRSLMCYVCLNVVSVENIVNHIWFTYLQCKDCDLTIKTCCMWEQLRKGRLEKCSLQRELHNFHKWAVDPVDFLYYQTRKILKRENDSYQPTEKEVIEEMANYTQKLSSLTLNAPWKDAVARCRKYIKGMKSTLSRSDRKALKREANNSEQKVPLSKSDGKISIKKSMGDISEETLSHKKSTEFSQEQPSNAMINESIPSNAGIAQLNRVAETNEILPEAHCINGEPAQEVDKINDEDVGDLLLPQPYNLEMLDQATTYVTVSELKEGENALVPQKPSNTPTPVDSCSQISVSKTLGTQIVTKERSEGHRSHEDQRTSDNTSNGYFLRYYYPDERVPEECPMCYHSFSPSMFVFNSSTLELKVECPDCKLLVFVSFEAKMASPKKKRKIAKHHMKILIKKTDT